MNVPLRMYARPKARIPLTSPPRHRANNFLTDPRRSLLWRRRFISL